MENPVYHRVIARKLKRALTSGRRTAPTGHRSLRGWMHQVERVSAWRQAKTWSKTAPSRLSGGRPPFVPKEKESRRVKPQPTCQSQLPTSKGTREKPVSGSRQRRAERRAGLRKEGSVPLKDPEPTQASVASLDKNSTEYFSAVGILGRAKAPLTTTDKGKALGGEGTRDSPVRGSECGRIKGVCTHYNDAGICAVSVRISPKFRKKFWECSQCRTGAPQKGRTLLLPHKTACCLGRQA